MEFFASLILGEHAEQLAVFAVFALEFEAKELLAGEIGARELFDGEFETRALLLGEVFLVRLLVVVIGVKFLKLVVTLAIRNTQSFHDQHLDAPPMDWRQAFEREPDTLVDQNVSSLYDNEL